MRLFLSYIKNHKNLLVGTLFLAAINQIFSLIDPQIYRLIIDRFASKPGDYTAEQFFSGVLLLLLAAIGAAFVSRVAKNFQDYYVNVITQRVGARLYADSVEHSMSLPFGVFEDRRSGEILQVMQKARTDSQVIITSAINIVFLSLIGVAFVVTYAFIVHWSVGLVYLALIPLVGLTTTIISRKIKKAQSEIVKETAELAGSTTETLRNVELVKSLGLESQETRRLNVVNDRILGLELKKVKLTRYLSFFQGTMVNALRSTILLLLLWLIFRQVVSIGEFFTLWIYSFFIFNPLAEFSNVASQYQEAKASMEKLQEVLSIEPEAKPENPVVTAGIESVEFKNVEFSYATGDESSVKNVSLQVKSGETVALVGPSGSGKSTLVKLLLGLYKPQGGQLLVNGVDASKLDSESFKKRIGYVSQDTQLFAGTIRENLLFVNPSASDSDCLKALEHAAALPIIERGGKGLDTKIGEGGIKISGGEKQRLAIARALLRQPELIVFDEATSALDSITEHSITQTIRDIAKSRPNLITILIAHRLSTISYADRIYVLEKGKLIESGQHDQLVEAGGLYSALWREQAGHSK